MPPEIGFLVPVGVRLLVSRHGPRSSLGPPIRRLDPEGTPSDETDVAAARALSAASGGGHTQPTAAGQGRAQWATVQDHLDRLLTVHRLPVERARRPVVDASSRQRSSRARRRVRQLDDGTRAITGPASVRLRQQAADRWWERLVANDPPTVAARLEHAFERHAMSVAVSAVHDGTAHLVLSVYPPERLIGHREPVAPGGEGRALRRMDETRRHQLYEAAITSGMLMVAVETLAVAPGLRAVALAVVCPGHLGGPAVLMLSELQRSTVLPAGADRPAIADLSRADAPDGVAVLHDRSEHIGALRPLGSDLPAVDLLLDAIEG